MAGDLRLDRFPWRGASVSVNVHLVAEIQEAGDLAQNEGLGDDGEGTKEDSYA